MKADVGLVISHIVFTTRTLSSWR